MSKVDLTVIRRPLKGVAVGGTLSVSPTEARILVAIKRATYKTVEQSELTYQTRMMSAEVVQPEPVAVPDHDAGQDEAEEVRPRRRTRRAQADE